MSTPSNSPISLQSDVEPEAAELLLSTKYPSICPLSLPSDLSPGGSSKGPYNGLEIVQGHHGKRRDAHAQGKRYIRATTISMLSDDVMLEIFDFCQKNHDPGPQILTLPETVWDWHILVHVCQRWRQVVFASPLRLNLQIVCTHGTPVRKNLDIWPAFPINIEYLCDDTFEGIDEDDVIAALEHPDRVSVVGLYRVLTRQQLGKIATVMQVPFPALTHLLLGSHVSDDVPILPSEFLGRSAPCLQKIQLVGIPFPALPALLLSTSDLVELYLSNIPQTGYISPDAMVAALATLTRLKDLDIGFLSPASRPDQLSLPPVTRTLLPALTYFQFHGVREYLEDFVARIYAPQLDFIFISYFNQLDEFETPQLWQFIEHSEDLNWPMCFLVEFHDRSVSFGAGRTTLVPEYGLFDDLPRYIDIDIVCEGVDWQVSHLAQTFNQIPAVVLSNAIHFAIISHSTSPEPEGMDDVEWLQLLRQFSSVQTLFVSTEFAGQVSRALEDIPAVMASDILPALDMLCLEDHPVSPIHKFIAARWESVRPVTTVNTRRAFEERVMVYLD